MAESDTLRNKKAVHHGKHGKHHKKHGSDSSPGHGNAKASIPTSKRSRRAQHGSSTQLKERRGSMKTLVATLSVLILAATAFAQVSTASLNNAEKLTGSLQINELVRVNVVKKDDYGIVLGSKLAKEKVTYKVYKVAKTAKDEGKLGEQSILATNIGQKKISADATEKLPKTLKNGNSFEKGDVALLTVDKGKLLHQIFTIEGERLKDPINLKTIEKNQLWRVPELKASIRSARSKRPTNLPESPACCLTLRRFWPRGSPTRPLALNGESAMNTEKRQVQQILLPFRGKKVVRRAGSNSDLIGLSYKDRRGRVTVIGLCKDDERQVLVQRRPGGSTWSMPAWLMRFVFFDKKNRLLAA